MSTAGGGADPRYPADVGQVHRIDPADAGAMSELTRYVELVEAEHGHPLLSDSIRLVIADPDRGDALRAVIIRHGDQIQGCALSGPANGGRVVEVVVPHDHGGDAEVDVVATLLGAISDADRAGTPLIWWCRGHEPWADEVAARAGLIEHRRLLQMRLPLDADVVSRLRQFAYATRPFRPGVDDTSWLELNNRCFADHPEQGDWTADDLRRRLAALWFDAAGFLMYPVEGSPIAFCWTKVHPADAHDPALGEIYVIGVDPDHVGQGHGRALTSAGLVSLADRGLRVGMLYVDAANSAAVRLYKSLGMAVHHQDRAFIVPTRP